MRNLRTANVCQDPPAFLKKAPKLKGNRAKGITYEKTVYRTLKRWRENGKLNDCELVYGQWFYFSDDTGVHWCQPDILIATDTHIVIIECKLTQTKAAWEQLEHLYKPVIELVFGKPVVMLQVCKNVKTTPDDKIACVSEVLHSPRAGLWTWHFLG